LVKTATGHEIGPVASVSVDPPEHYATLVVWTAAGKLAYVSQETGKVTSVVGRVYETSDCSGQAYAPVGTTTNSVTFIASDMDGDRLWIATSVTPRTVMLRASDTGAGCTTFGGPPSSESVIPVREVTDLAYPYAAPLVLSYE
jgi:hypothetical protein